MNAAMAYRALLLIRGAWSILEWFFDWGSTARIDSFKLLHPYVALVGGTLAEALFLSLLLGLWFFRRWARWLFVVLLALAFIYGAFRPYDSTSVPPSFVIAIMWFMVMLHGAIVAMSFLPPLRDMFADRT
jgi:hypothetical protein